MKNIFLQTIILTFLLGCGTAESQKKTDDQLAKEQKQAQDSVSKRIDDIFFKDQSKPGWVIGVVRNDTLIYKKAGGVANLEYGIKNNIETKYHLASISKQITAYCIILLAKENKLSLDDDIRKYLKWLPDFKQKITVRNLLNHTSGIRDYWQLWAISGMYSDDIILQENVIKLLSQQQTLNVKPGEEYMYSNSNYVLLAEIIKSTSGQSLREFSDSMIFKPLKMKNTFFSDNIDEVISNRAYSYYINENGEYSNSKYNSSVIGSTGLLSTIEDFSKWISNYYNPVIGTENDIKTLTTKGILNNGEVLGYANGLLISDFMGWKSYWHNGSDAGFNSFMAVFPEKKLGFIMFSNSIDLNPMMCADKLLELFLKENTDKPKTRNIFNEMSYSITDSIKYNSFIGDYISKAGFKSSIKKVNGKLCLNIFGRDCQIKQINADTFKLQYNNSAKIIFHKSKLGESTIKILNISNTNQELIKVNYDFKINKKELINYTGNFYSSELDCHYKIVLKNNELYLTHKRLQDFKLQLIEKDHILNDSGHMSHLTIIRDNTNKIIGFEVNNDRVLKLQFKRL